MFKNIIQKINIIVRILAHDGKDMKITSLPHFILLLTMILYKSLLLNVNADNNYHQNY